MISDFRIVDHDQTSRCQNHETALSVDRRKRIRGRSSQTRTEVRWKGSVGNEATHVDVWTGLGLGGLFAGKNEVGAISYR